MPELLYANIETITLQFLNLYGTLGSHPGITGMDNLQLNFPKPGLTARGCISIPGGMSHATLQCCTVPDQTQGSFPCVSVGLGADESLLLSAGLSAVRTASLELLLDSQIGSQTRGWRSSTAWELLLF